MEARVTISSHIIIPDDNAGTMRMMNKNIKAIEAAVMSSGGQMKGVTMKPEKGFTASFIVPLGYAEIVFQKIRKTYQNEKTTSHNSPAQF